MPDFNVRSDSVNVEQIMEQIRARIREKRGVDYTEDQIRELAAVKLEKFLDPRGIRSDLLEQFRRTPLPDRPNYAFEDDTLFETHRGFVRFMRRLLSPLLKLLFNPNPLIQALHIQSHLNTLNAEREAAFDQLYFELVHNLVLEITRLGVEVKNLKMRVESLGSRVEFNERRARALESVVVYRPGDDRESAPVVERPAPPVTPPPSRGSWQGRPQGPGSQGSRGSQGSQGSRGSQGSQGWQGSQGSSAATSGPVQSYTAGPQQTAEAGPGPSSSVQEVAASIVPGQSPSTGSGPGDGPGQRSRRRRRRRGRRGGGSAMAIMGQPGPGSVAPSADSHPQGTPSESSEAHPGAAAAPSAEAYESRPEEPGPGSDEPDGQ